MKNVKDCGIISIIAAATTLIATLSIVTGTNPTVEPAYAQQNTTKPMDGYNRPDGHVNAIRHVFNDAGLRVEHFCKADKKIVITCQLYDSVSQNGTLIGLNIS